MQRHGKRNAAPPTPQLVQLAVPSRQGWLLGRPGDVSFNILNSPNTALTSLHTHTTRTFFFFFFFFAPGLILSDCLPPTETHAHSQTTGFYPECTNPLTVPSRTHAHGQATEREHQRPR